MLQAMQNMSPEEARQIMEQMTPEQRTQMQRMQEGMLDLKHICEQLKPAADDPDAAVSLLKVVRALATAPLLLRLPSDADEREAAEKALDECDDEQLRKLEAAFVAAGALEEGALATCEADERRNVLLLYWHMHQSNMPNLKAALPTGVDQMRSYLNNLATKLLVRAQMAMPQQRWVQPTLAVAHASALVSTALWSHTDGKALEAMRTILQEDGLSYPKLSIKSKAGPRGTSGEGDECAAGQQVQVTVELTRNHAKTAGDEVSAPPCNNPQGIYEAYWLFIEGLKPEGTPNSLVCAQPMVVKDLAESVVKAEQTFVAPPNPGKYTLRVHLVSTSVIGIDLTTDASFIVVEDDVPDLE